MMSGDDLNASDSKLNEQVIEVMQLLTAHAVVVLVEGPVDQKFWRRFTDGRIGFMPCEGKDRVMAIVTTLVGRNQWKGVLAIVDADFQRCENEEPLKPHVLWHDGHDLECMLLLSGAFLKVLQERCGEKKVTDLPAQGDGIRQQIFSVAMPVGLLRWYSQQKQLSLRFDGLDFTKFVDISTLAIDESKLLKAIGDKSTRHDLVASLEQGLRELERRQCEASQVCCGHDALEMLAIGLRKLWGNEKPAECTPKELERELRLAFDASHLRQTRVYTEIRLWEHWSKLSFFHADVAR